MRSTSWLPVAVLVLPLLADGVARAEGPRVRVRAESRIGLRTVGRGHPLRLRGVLKDDQGTELPGRDLEIRLLGERTRTQDVTTDATGRFELEVVDDEGIEAVEVLFRGDAWHRERRVRRGVEPGLVDVRLHFATRRDGSEPGAGKIDLDGPPLEVAITAQSDLGSGGLPVEIDVVDGSGRRRVAAGVTDRRGELTLSIPASELGEPGPGRLVARSLRRGDRAPATSEQPILRYRHTRTFIDRAPDRASPGRPVDVVGRVEFSAEAGRGVPGAAVGIYADGAHVGTALTDDDGRFDVRAPLPDAPARERTLVARFDGPGTGLEGSVSAPRTLRWEPGPAGRWAAAAAGLLGVVLLALAFRRRPLPSAAPSTPMAGVRLARRRVTPRREVAGRVVADEDGRPLTAARVALVDASGVERLLPVDGDARFASPPLAAGGWTLRVDAPDHGERSEHLDVPHRGEWSDVEVRLEDLRTVALERFRRAVAPMLPSPRRWEVQTNREIVHAVGAREDLVALERRVEAIYYGPAPPARELVEALPEPPSDVADRTR